MNKHEIILSKTLRLNPSYKKIDIQFIIKYLRFFYRILFIVAVLYIIIFVEQ